MNLTLSPETADQCKKKLEEIAVCIASNLHLSTGYGLFTGKPGIALFYLYYSRFTKEEKYFDIGNELISSALKDIASSERSSPFLSNGICGIAWCIDLLYNTGISENKATDVFGPEIYDYLHHSALTALTQGNYDYLHGATGNLIYLNERKYDITLPLDKLFDWCKENSATISWPSIIPHGKEDKYNSLMVAHGNANILFLLIRVYQQSPSPTLFTKIRKLIHHYMSSPLKTDDMPGWCSGYLGIGYLLYETAESMADEQLKTFSLSLLTNGIIDHTLVKDAGFCHGSAGIAYLYRRLYQKTGSLYFHDAATHWCNATLDYTSDINGATRYKSYKGNTFYRSLSLLDGIAGTGLVLLSFLSETVPHWDRFFLLSSES